MYRTILCVALALGLAAPALGQGQDYPATVSHVVWFGDLDLSTASGARELDRRVQAAARFVCRVPTTSPLIPFLYSRKCTDGALRDARPRVASAVASARRDHLRDSAIEVAAH